MKDATRKRDIVNDMKAISKYISTSVLLPILVAGGLAGQALGNDMRFFECAIHGFPDSENFVAATANPAVIATVEQQLLLPPEERMLHIHGLIDTGNAGYNLDWNWHFVEDDWGMAEISMELCDGTSSYLEANLDYWLMQVEYFCPWSSYILREVEGFVCGDVNNDEAVDLLDILYLIAFVYSTPVGPAPQPYDSGNVNADGAINVLDILYLIGFIYNSPPGPEPVCP